MHHTVSQIHIYLSLCLRAISLTRGARFQQNIQPVVFLSQETIQINWNWKWRCLNTSLYVSVGKQVVFSPVFLMNGYYYNPSPFLSSKLHSICHIRNDFIHHNDTVYIKNSHSAFSFCGNVLQWNHLIPSWIRFWRHVLFLVMSLWCPKFSTCWWWLDVMVSHFACLVLEILLEIPSRGWQLSWMSSEAVSKSCQ